MIVFDQDNSHGADYTDEKVMVASLKCDSIDEIKDDLSQMEIVGWPEGYSLGFDSTAMSLTFDIKKYNSSGHWV